VERTSLNWLFASAAANCHSAASDSNAATERGDASVAATNSPSPFASFAAKRQRQHFVEQSKADCIKLVSSECSAIAALASGDYGARDGEDQPS